MRKNREIREIREFLAPASRIPHFYFATKIQRKSSASRSPSQVKMIESGIVHTDNQIESEEDIVSEESSVVVIIVDSQDNQSRSHKRLPRSADWRDPDKSTFLELYIRLKMCYVRSQYLDEFIVRETAFAAIFVNDSSHALQILWLRPTGDWIIMWFSEAQFFEHGDTNTEVPEGEKYNSIVNNLASPAHKILSMSWNILKKLADRLII